MVTHIEEKNDDDLPLGRCRCCGQMIPIENGVLMQHKLPDEGKLKVDQKCQGSLRLPLKKSAADH